MRSVLIALFILILCISCRSSTDSIGEIYHIDPSELNDITIKYIYINNSVAERKLTLKGAEKNAFWNEFLKTKELNGVRFSRRFTVSRAEVDILHENGKHYTIEICRLENGTGYITINKWSGNVFKDLGSKYSEELASFVFNLER
uniref:hypothetical protein n=1 Tax=Roseivirga sp. TaxID=1964215 RepID=UPI00404817FF